jgi:hypothetical protein
MEQIKEPSSTTVRCLTYARAFSRLNDDVCAFMFCNRRDDSVELLYAYKQALFSIRQSGGKRKQTKNNNNVKCCTG